ncbi:SEC-C domain-containing protein [Saccharibacillus sacchari]|uniref:SEC-C domain-containing protein n=1 Tax=Saccharibacillus sacchari TaxID=456493 RepID=A0ACC6PH81_9BACL
MNRSVAAVSAGRNDPCLCGSGLKYKKCCAQRDEQARDTASRQASLQSALREFFSIHPRPSEQKALSAWKQELAPRLQAAYGAEKTDAVVGDTFFFGEAVDIWNAFVQAKSRDVQNAAIADALKGWIDPRFAVLRILGQESSPFGTAEGSKPVHLPVQRPSVDSAQKLFVRASEVLSGEVFELRADDSFRPRPGMIVLGFWLPGASPEAPKFALNSLVLIEEPDDAAVLRLERLRNESDAAELAAFYRSRIACVYEAFGEPASANAADFSPEKLPESVTEAIRRLDNFLIRHDVKHDRLMDVAFRFLKRKRQTPDAGTAAAAAIVFGLAEGWLTNDWNAERLAEKFGAVFEEVERLAKEMADFERKTAVYQEEAETIGFRIGTDPMPDEFRQWRLYMHIKDLDIQGEAALRRQMEYFSGIPYVPVSAREEAQLRAYEAYMARENEWRGEKWTEARRLYPDNADVLLLAAEFEADASLRLNLLERAEQSAFESFEADIRPPWLHMPNRPYLRALMRRALHDWENGLWTEAFERFYKLLRLNPADHQGARYPALSALIARGDLQAAAGLLAHYAEDAGDNAIYRWFDWVIRYRKDRLDAETEKAYRAAVEANPYMEKRVRDRFGFEAMPYPRSAVMTPRSPEEASFIWTLIRPALLN